MPKPNHSKAHDAFRPEDESFYKEDKQEFQESEKDKKAKAISEEEFVAEQDKQSEG